MKRLALLLGLRLLVGISSPTTAASADVEERVLANPILWPSTPPADCPFEQSKDIAGILFTGRHNEYSNADTWYPTWAADGNMYSPWTDGNVYGVGCMSIGVEARTGNGKIEGGDPLNLKVTALGTEPASPLPYGGRYPCGSLVHNGIWYYGTYCLMNEDGSTKSDVTIDGMRYNWGVLGPFVGFRISRDFGKTWTPCPHTPEKALFREPARIGGPVKIGAPHFVDFGKNMEHSPDGKAYLVGMGAPDPDPKPRRANLSWITGDQIYMCRITPLPENINDASKYEFFGGNDEKGRPIWTNEFAKIKPLVDWNNRCGCVTMTYNAPLKKYILCITDGWPTAGTMNTYLLESDKITGPWRMITFMEKFGTQGYFVNIPSKFIGADGRTAWLCYAANFAGGSPNPPGSRYAMNLQEIRLLTPEEYDSAAKVKSADPVKDERNIAPRAKATASSVHPDYKIDGAIDRALGGFPGNIKQEWASNAENVGVWIRLEWPEPVTIERVALWDRPNNLDQITGGVLAFSDGSTVKIGALPDGGEGKEIAFPARTVKWLEFKVTAVKPKSPNIGLAEIAVYKAR
jgi:hypothetical protein